MDNETIVDDNIELPKRNAPEVDVKHAAMRILDEAGMGGAAIAKALDYHPKSVSRVLPKIRKESLIHPSMVKLAGKTVKGVMAGFVDRSDGRVKASDAMRAAELVYSRAEPVQQESGLNSTQLFFQVNQQFITHHK